MVWMFSSVSLLLLVTLTHSRLASMNRVALSVLDFYSTMMQVAMEVPKNRLSGSWMMQSMKLLSMRY